MTSVFFGSNETPFAIPPAHHLLDGGGSRSSRLIYCVAYGQDSRVICIAKAALGVAQLVDWLSIE
jgi:hypothetical protein